MNASDIPFAKYIGIKEKEERFFLEYSENISNHIRTIHAGAQFTLAETRSGIYLLKLFPELEGKTVVVLRDAKIKYKKPATGTIVANSYADEDKILQFQSQFEKKGRGLLEIKVEIKDDKENLASVSTFIWYIQKL